MPRTLVVHVNLHDASYHGVPDWPPSPARLFQALVAGAATHNGLLAEDCAALEWLECLPPPTIAAPTAKQTRGFFTYVPNNDLDSKGGDPARVSEIRTPKLIKPRLLDSQTPIRYFWDFEENPMANQCAARICYVAERLYQLGRGVDMAWACGEVLEGKQAGEQLSDHRGTVHYPHVSSGGATLACPEIGSLESLIRRHQAHCKRFVDAPADTKFRQVFVQPPKPRFRQIGYDNPPTTKLYDLVGTLAPWPLVKASELVTRIRDVAVKRLVRACPQLKDQVERVLIGRGTTHLDGEDRVRIIPMPSIGSPHADRAIRRVSVRIPAGCPIRPDDIDWALSGLAPEANPGSGEVLLDLVSAADHRMLRHYGFNGGENERCWRTVTPAALPEDPTAQRIERPRGRGQQRAGSDRVSELRRATSGVLRALRHANITTRASSIRVQREPFDAKGARAEVFCVGTRFARERLWHVEISFIERVSGPMIIGDGRYAGLGLMAPVCGEPDTEGGLICFSIVDGLNDSASSLDCASSLRRAVMSRVQQLVGYRNRLPLFFSGHEPNGAPARNETHSHLAYAADLSRNRLLVIAPHVLERRPPTDYERAQITVLNAALKGFADLRAGASGRLGLEAVGVDPHSDPLLASSQLWETVTEYIPTRHAKRVSSSDSLAIDVRRELRRLKMPDPVELEVVEMHVGPRGGLRGRLRLRFATAVPGLLLLGRTRHFGGGLFSSLRRN